MTNRLSKNPVHLGLGATAEIQPDFTGSMEWYGEYTERHGDDGFEGRLVSMHEMNGAWDMWEMHPFGAELVVCTAGTLELTQELPQGNETVTLSPGEYVINPPGIWHTAEASSSGTALFITAGVGTEHRPR